MCGLAVFAVMLQSTGGFRAELLGADMVLAVGGYLTTRTLLDAAWSHPDVRMPLGAWYRDHFKQRVPLLLFTLAVTLGLAVALSPPAQAGHLGMAAIAGLAHLGNWFDLALRTGFVGSDGDWYADRPGQIDPLGLLWLLGLFEQFALVWPVLLVGIWWVAGRFGGRSGGTSDAGPSATERMAWLTVTLCLLLAGVACLVGPMRAMAGADLTELALGTHVRAAEWLLGACAAALVVAVRARGGDELPADSRGTRGSWWPTVAGVIVLAALVINAMFATARPADWLRAAGPTLAAGCVALLLVIVDRPAQPRPGSLQWLLGQGGPVELGRMAYPLLVLHLPVFWLLGHAVAQARSYALLVVGGALAWLVGLLLQDGVVGRLRARRWWVGRTASTLVAAYAAIAAGGFWLPAVVDGQLRTGKAPVALVLGGSFAGDLASALGGHGSGRYSVVDGSLPGCGLFSVPSPAAPHARVTADAQLPVSAPARSAGCVDWERQWRSMIDKSRPDILVVDLSGDAAARPDHATVVSPCDVAYRHDYRERLAAAARIWAQAAPGRPVLLADTRSVTGDTDPQSSRCYNALIVEAVARYPQVLLLDVDAALCTAGQCWTRTASGHPFYFDAVHLTPSGMHDLAPWLESAVNRALGSDQAVIG
ncbi:SGNH hydrolase domain-containing protein [Frankia sp. Cppng1_Ct_nod]|uniref:SGNH hydrolase domain-containing protein n=1 Tax=Frankia sp. Cppng1_Ct_nod TaxID=2897162 RepID=UPI001040F01B|nr:SGNH hydrolase domain-containing protein [Frankia sp. Cppng1_Ct_nod]